MNKILDTFGVFWYVQYVNNKEDITEDYRSLQLLDEISKNKDLTQRDLSNKLGVALGLINSYLKNLASKGYITVSTIPKKRYSYYLTPSGFKEKARLTYHHLQNYTNLYRVARKDFRTLFDAISEDPAVESVAFCGIDEITDIAYLSLKEVGVTLSTVIDDKLAGGNFFGHEIVSMNDARVASSDLIIITSFKDGDQLAKSLVDGGIDMMKICDISKGGWLKRVTTQE
jgi:predicted transcriptional regulator